jgi:uncharacterized protein involved in cysteine biosynthesis
MSDIFSAAARATSDLVKPGILWHAIWPTLLSIVLWWTVAYLVWTPLLQWLAALIPHWSWVPQDVYAWLAGAALFMAFAVLAYLSALMLLSAFALPRMMAIVAERDYADLARNGGGAVNALWGSLVNTLKIAAIFVCGLLPTLPLLLIPGMLLILPFCWLTWINQRSFRYDALADHATRAERDALVRNDRRLLYLAGALSALATFIPIVNLLAPAWTALLFIHLCLARLRRQRQQDGRPAAVRAAV